MRWPEMPEGVEDRAADVWEALLAVADLAGGDWPERARRSAVALVADSARRPATLGVLLLSDLRDVFAAAGTDRLSTDDVLTGLVERDESPWGDLRGKPLDARRLSRMLDGYEVKPKNLRIDGQVLKGYDAGDLADPWSRYLPPVGNPTPAAPVVQGIPPLGKGEAAAPEAKSSFGAAPPAACATSATPLHEACSGCGDPLDEWLLSHGETSHIGCTS
jgi:hypothetical protein